MKPDIIVITGPTASGKTALGVEMALRHNGEIISADSMQIYKGMDIATAKPSVSEMKGIPHHLIGFLDNDAEFSVADYVELANEKIRDILSKGKLPVIVGGTGLYISSLTSNIRFADVRSDPRLREELAAQARSEGNEVLLERLAAVDPATASQLHANNLTRVIRALEVYELTGRTLSELNEESRKYESPYNFIKAGINYTDRQFLYDRINSRVDAMIEAGLIEEARHMYQTSQSMKTARQAIGFKELIPYFKDEQTLESCIDKIKQETRRYAKRQLTWFRRDGEIQWIMADNTSDINFFIKKCENIIAKQ
ncbi:MAG: tRNA (adenosine(37)-N6)-dimethylallyltransferase MiaA [Oscillospiraceae bacterium]|nr:tRNA (adenosine(37)-N6)-dimethylallyltransferase MiaA [Oscillospiraceae bacterium]